MSLTVSVCGVSLLLLLHFVGAKHVSDLQVSLPELSAGVNVSFIIMSYLLLNHCGLVSQHCAEMATLF